MAEPGQFIRYLPFGECSAMVYESDHLLGDLLSQC